MKTEKSQKISFKLIKIKKGKSLTIGLFTSIALLLAGSQNLLAVDVSVTLLPAAPLNAGVLRSIPTQVTLSWDASPSPASAIDSYTVFYKETTEPSFPGTPQITRTDSLASYSEVITVTAGIEYDFRILANTGSLASTSSCASCEASTLDCGNGTIDPAEQCDGVNLAGAVCADFNYLYGNLACSATCQFSFNNCVTGGGGGSSNEDNFPPNPGVITVPEFANTSPIKISYSNASDPGNSGLNYVTLLYKKGTNAWANSGLKSSETSGSFDFVPDASPNSTYYFALQAFDNRGNTSKWPVNPGKAKTVYDRQAPTIELIDISASKNGSPIKISYQNAVDTGISGLDRVELRYRQEGSQEWLSSDLNSVKKDDVFEFGQVTGSGTYYFDLIAFDKAGNQSTETEESETAYVYDVSPPVLGTASFADSAIQTPIVIEYEGAVDVGSGELKQIELWYKKGISGSWTASGLSSQSPDGSFSFTPSDDEVYYFDFVLEDSFGNQSKKPSGDGRLNTLYTSFPFQVLLSNLPAQVSDQTAVSIQVGGEGVTAYRYKLNDGSYSEEISVEIPLVLSDLPEGDNVLSLIAKNEAGIWQKESEAMTHRWSISLPEFEPVIPKSDIAEILDLFPEVTPATPVESDEPAVEDETSPTEADKTESSNQSDQTEVAEGGTTQSPEITPPKPAIHYSAQEIHKKAQAVFITHGLVKETSITIRLPDTPEQVMSRIDQCKLDYVGLSFTSSGLDSDNDGLSDRTECYALTNPLIADSDGDGCLDGDEVNQYASSPLDAQDCQPEERLKTVSLSNPQAGWLLSRLEEVTGLTPNTTSQVHLIAFSVQEGESLTEEPIELGIVDEFDPSSVQGQYFFELKPQITLSDGQEYDLVAVSVLTNGETISSSAVRFSLDSKRETGQPNPTAIGNVLINDDLRLENIQIRTSEDGKVEVTGESEYGVQVFATWQSIVLASSIIADSSLGEFSIQSPQPMTLEENHETTLFAVKIEDGQKLKSRNVTLNFRINSPKTFPYRATILAVILLLLILLFAKMFNKWRAKEEGVKNI